MASFFYLTLDTTPPVIEIYAPSYVTRETDTEVTVQADSPLSSLDVYIIDSVGEKRTYTFQYDNTAMQYRGIINFNDYPLGEMTIYAQVQDDVWNESLQVTKTVNIKESLSRMTLTVDNKARNNVVATKNVAQLVTNKKTRQITITTTEG